MFDQEEINRPQAEESVLWFFDHITWGHLDEVPDQVLDDLLGNYDRSGRVVFILLGGQYAKETEDPIDLAHWANSIHHASREPFVAFRQWIFAERARRLNLLGDSQLPDTLIKDLIKGRPPIDKPSVWWKTLNQLVYRKLNITPPGDSM